MKGVIDIANAPEYAAKKKWIVATVYNHTLWFWGAWSDRDAAERAIKNSDDESLILLERETEHE